MNISAPRVEAISSPASSQGQYAGQSAHIAKKRLARGYIPALCAGVSIPLLTFAAAAFPLNATGVIAVTAWVSVEIVYIVHVLIDKQRSLEIAARKWDELHDQAETMADAYYARSCAYERLSNKYNALYAEYLLQRGVASLVAKRSGKGAAADSSGALNGSAAVVPFTKTDGAA